MKNAWSEGGNYRIHNGTYYYKQEGREYEYIKYGHFA